MKSYATSGLTLAKGKAVQDLALARDEFAQWQGDTVRMRAVWREGDGRNIVVWPEGNAYDHVTGEKYSADDMLRLLGAEGELFSLSAEAPKKKRKTKRKISEDESKAVLRDLRATMRAYERGTWFLPVAAQNYLAERGLDRRAWEGLIGHLAPPKAALPYGAPFAQWWIAKQLARGGPAILCPLRDAKGAVCSFAMRFYDMPVPSVSTLAEAYAVPHYEEPPKILFPPADVAPLRDEDGVDYVYGEPKRILSRSTSIVVVTEGWADWMAVRQLAGKARHIAAIGVRDCNHYGIDSYFAGCKARVVIAPDIDNPDKAVCLMERLRADGVATSLFPFVRWVEAEWDTRLESQRRLWLRLADFADERENQKWGVECLRDKLFGRNGKGGAKDIGDVVAALTRTHRIGDVVEVASMDGSGFMSLLSDVALGSVAG